MSNPIDALRRYLDTSPSLVGLASPSGSYVKKEEMLEVIRLAELGLKVRDMEADTMKDIAEPPESLVAANARADAFLEALRLIVGVKP